jgi:hypothetical protein
VAAQRKRWAKVRAGKKQYPRDGAMLDVTKLTEEERGFYAGITKRLGSGDVKSVGTELLAEFVKGLTPEVFQKGYRLADVLCEGE